MVYTPVAGTGSPGPPGATGPAGPTGPAGSTGPAGPAGQGVPVAGTTNQVLAKRSATDYDTQWQTPAGGSGLPVVVRASGDWLWAPNQNAFGSSTPGTTNALYTFAWLCDFNGALQAIQFNVSVAYTSATFRIGMYSDSGGYPASLILDSGAISVATLTGWYGPTGLNIPVTAGTVYWLGVGQTAASGSGMLQAIQTPYQPPVALKAQGSPPTAIAQLVLNANMAPGALPATFPAGVTGFNTGYKLGLQVK